MMWQSNSNNVKTIGNGNESEQNLSQSQLCVDCSPLPKVVAPTMSLLFLNSSTRYTYKVSHWDVDINENLFSAIRHTHFRIVDQPLLQQAEMKKQCNAIHFASHQSRESNHQKKKTNHRTKKRIIKKPFFRVANHQKVLNHQKNPPKFKKGHS